VRAFLERHFRLLVAVPLLLLAALQVSSALLESQTFDEGVHLVAGYRYWRTGDFSLNVEHPPLQKLLSAAPLLLLAPPLPADPKLLIDQSEYARAFLYKGPQPADRLIFLGRLPTIALTLLLALAVALTALRYFGHLAALIAVWLCALDPNLIAHGRYVTTDLASALFFFCSVVAWLAYLEAPGRKRFVLAALALGLALGAKFSMVILLPVLPALALLRWLMTRHSWRGAVRSLGAFALALVMAAGVVALLYAPEVWRTFRGRRIKVDPITVEGVTLPALTYATGLRTVLDHNREGHAAFLLGEVRETGWWYYFPVVFAVKSTTALLLLTVLALALAFRAVRATGALIWLSLLIPPLFYFGVSMTSHINLGVRHLLPVYPFLYLLGAAALVHALSPRRLALVAGMIVLLQAAESLTVYPEYLAFFNAPSGGRAAGAHYLLDSNLDWGQDLKKLKTYIDRNNPGTVCLDYFGYADPGYYGMRWEYLPKTWDKDELERMDCVGAISVTLLNDLYIRKGSYEWLRRRTPFGVAGSSIYLYDLRKPKP